MNNQFNSPPTKGSAKDFAYYEIKRRIIDGILQPNQPVSEEDLSSKLNISRTPLRGALEKLEFEKMVIRQPNGRLKIAPISVEEVKEIFKVRSKLEEIAVAEATENATQEDIKNLKDIADNLRDASKEGNIEELLKYGVDFHSYIYELSRNGTVNNFLSQLYDHIHRYRRLVPNQSVKRAIEEGEEHQLILECITNKDIKGAELAMKKHIENSLSSAITAIGIYEKNNSIW
ncbi:GntR family transcriptional regulator [Fredinandcohnia salidurans]|uniref:GntR family transcriptional regulator n=1 Tax=Fredinandcohnia salidurans TaxID=2595041 RepID=A0ABW4MMC0_9BACI|nr:GntR family transcriptional regulator [Fredinandcohnia onubensis]